MPLSMAMAPPPSDVEGGPLEVGASDPTGRVVPAAVPSGVAVESTAEEGLELAPAPPTQPAAMTMTARIACQPSDLETRTPYPLKKSSDAHEGRICRGRDVVCHRAARIGLELLG